MIRRPDPATAAQCSQRFSQLMSDSAIRVAWTYLDAGDPVMAAETLDDYLGDLADPAYVEVRAAVTVAVAA